MNTPLVSICLLTYMHEKYIEDCIKSIIAQTYENIELLVLDDFSSDHTFEIIQRYEKLLKQRFKRVHLKRNIQNSGNISANVNQMSKMAQGDYIKHIGGDDALLPDYMEKVVACMEKYKSAIMCYTNAYIVNDNFRLGDNPGRIYAYENHIPCSQSESFKRLLKRNYIIAGSVTFRRDVFEKYGYYDERILFEDYEYWLRLSQKEEFVYLPEKLLYYRIAETSLTNFASKDGRKKIVYMMQGEIQVYEMYTRNISSEEKRVFHQYFYDYYLQEALQANLWRVALQIMFIMRKHKYKIDMKKVRGILKQNNRKNCAENELADKHLTILRLFNQWIVLYQEGKSIVNYFQKNHIKSVAIYGMSYVGERLYDELKGSDIEVKYAIDRNSVKIFTDLEMFMPEDALPEVDAIIVTAVYFYDEIRKKLRENVDYPIYSLEDIIYNL